MLLVVQAFNHVCLVMIIDEIHNAEYWNFLDSAVCSCHKVYSKSVVLLHFDYSWKYSCKIGSLSTEVNFSDLIIWT